MSCDCILIKNDLLITLLWGVAGVAIMICLLAFFLVFRKEKNEDMTLIRKIERNWE